MSKPKGITVTLYERTQTGVDAFNAPVYGETQSEISNVLVHPEGDGGGEQIIDETNLSGRRSSYILAIPKGDTHTWENCRVSFFGKTWKVIGMPTEGIDSLIPLQWNRKVRVEAIE